jgi:hypothetical protein
MCFSGRERGAVRVSAVRVSAVQPAARKLCCVSAVHHLICRGQWDDALVVLLPRKNV